MKINEKIKLNLIINKSAALNLLGRYSETISLYDKGGQNESSDWRAKTDSI
jgi:hypothetical protein